jgi:hypothetical protein
MSVKTDEKGKRKEVRVFDIGSNAGRRDWRRLKNVVEAVTNILQRESTGDIW